ncbi:MAG: TolC family protein [Porticoccus sp.]|nr:TolC family protein [Porticoccus sp.]
MRIRKHQYLFIFLIILLLNSCSIAPQTDYAALVKQDHDLVRNWEQQKTAQQTTSLNQLINSPELNNLIAEALAANPTLQQTMLSLKIIQAQYRQAKGDRLPEASYDVSGEKDEGDDQSYSGSLTISWELDVWQKLTDSKNAAAMDEAEQQEIFLAARDSLAAQVMKGWLGLISDQHTIDIEQNRLEILEQNEGYILQRYRNGIGTLEDLDSSRASTAVSRASLEEYRENLDQRQRTIKTLLGRTGTDKVIATETYPKVITPLADLPEQTLQRRPDLKAAYFAIEAADYRTSVAYKDLLPSFSLEAALNDISDSPQSMLLSDPLWALLGQFTAPLFQGGKLKSAAEIAGLETAQSYQAYRETLLDAISEVENALSLEQSITRRQKHIQSALTSARNSLTRYQENYRSGLVDILDLITVQEKTFDIAAQLDNLIYDRLVNRIELGLALGLGVTQ